MKLPPNEELREAARAVVTWEMLICDDHGFALEGYLDEAVDTQETAIDWLHACLQALPKPPEGE